MRQLLLVHLLGCMAWATSLLNFLIQQQWWHQLPCKVPHTFWLTAPCANYALSQSIFNYEPKILNPSSPQGSQLWAIELESLPLLFLLSPCSVESASGMLLQGLQTCHSWSPAMFMAKASASVPVLKGAKYIFINEASPFFSLTESMKLTSPCTFSLNFCICCPIIPYLNWKA